MRTYSLISTNFVLAFSYHWYHPAPIPPPIPGVFVPHVEGGVPLGYSMILRNISDDVTFDGRGVVRVAHDVGFLIPHISIPPLPPNVWLLKDIPLSSAMVTFAKMNVLVNNISAGNFHVFMPMLVCGDMPRIRLPFGMVVDAPFRNTVSFNFTWTDLLLGIVNSILNFALAFAFGKLANWGADPQTVPPLRHSPGQQIWCPRGVLPRPAVRHVPDGDAGNHLPGDGEHPGHSACRVAGHRGARPGGRGSQAPALGDPPLR